MSFGNITPPIICTQKAASLEYKLAELICAKRLFEWSNSNALLVVCIPFTSIHDMRRSEGAERVGYADNKIKNTRLMPRQFSHSPQENIWVLLRKSLEKTGATRLKSQFCPEMVAFYAKARTYFNR